MAYFNIDPQPIEATLQKKISQQIRIARDGSIYYVITPFYWRDGDIYYIALEQGSGGNLILTDHGHTMMHLSYSMDYNSLRKGTRDKIIRKTLSQFGIQRKDDDELFIEAELEELGDALVDMIQAITRISDVEYLTREQVKDTFFEDFREFLTQTVPPERIEFDYVNSRHDPKGLYQVDARVNGTEVPMYIFAINTDDKAQEVTIGLYEHEKWGEEFRSTAIFRDQTEISRNVLARLSNVIGQQFSSLATNQPRIKQYLHRELDLS